MKSAPRSSAVRIDEFASKLEMLMISRFQFKAAVAASNAGLNAAHVTSHANHATVLPSGTAELIDSVTVIWSGGSEKLSTTA